MLGWSCLRAQELGDAGTCLAGLAAMVRMLRSAAGAVLHSPRLLHGLAGIGPQPEVVGVLVQQLASTTQALAMRDPIQQECSQAACNGSHSGRDRCRCGRSSAQAQPGTHECFCRGSSRPGQYNSQRGVSCELPRCPFRSVSR